MAIMGSDRVSCNFRINYRLYAYLYALQILPTEQASVYAYINPVVAVILGSIIFNEKLTIFIAIGGVVTLIGFIW